MVRRPFILSAFKPIFVVFTDYRPEPRADLATPVCGAKIEAELACANGLSVMSYSTLSKALYLRLSPLQALVLRAPGSARAARPDSVLKPPRCMGGCKDGYFFL